MPKKEASRITKDLRIKAILKLLRIVGGNNGWDSPIEGPGNWNEAFRLREPTYKVLTPDRLLSVKKCCGRQGSETRVILKMAWGKELVWW